ncbi:hypothetical protein AMK27_02635 [Streptomyces sp. CB02009]|uniref:hypothetical protein n=1 Tax=Streptomyces sp. CB02009 TaxID=1703938 RepID=UPI00093A06FB|nr:hypothetical protein [Streptomyces sp. CB02009]OKJ64792.1 hypothetical protein AMK27_02635 [Streptomyces sp. CB02009]
MCLFQYDDDSEPEEPDPAGLLYVPFRPGTHVELLTVDPTLTARAVTGPRASAGSPRTGLDARDVGQGARTF